MKHANCYRCDSYKISASERGTWVCKTLAEYQMVMQVEKKLVPYVSRGGILTPVLYFLMYNLKNRYHSTKSQSNEFIFREND